MSEHFSYSEMIDENNSSLIYYMDDYVSVKKVEFVKRIQNVESLTVKTKIDIAPDFNYLKSLGKKISKKCNFKFKKIKTVNNHFFLEAKDCFIQGYVNEFKFNGDAASKIDFTVITNSAKQSAKKIKSIIEESFQGHIVKGITWAYNTTRGIQYKSMNVEQNRFPVLTSYYPTLKKEIGTYFDDYIKSSATVLVLIGPPGTGKTTFIRELIMKKELNALVTYDKSLIASDNFFMDFLDSDEYDTLIIEDADTILKDRKDSGNELMDKFLNASDGLIKSPNKKIIFSTNLEKISDIDPALTRPGRCFDAMEFGKIEYDDIAELIKKSGANIDISRFNRNSKYTIAEIFNPDYNDYSEEVQETTRKIGF